MGSVTALSPTEARTVADNLGLAQAFVTSRDVPAHERDEMLSDAYVGLCKAVRGWQPERGALSTYAYRRMGTEVARGFYVRHGRTVRGELRIRHASLHAEEMEAVPGVSHEDDLSHLETEAQLTEVAACLMRACNDPLDVETVSVLFELGDTQGVRTEVQRRTGVSRNVVAKRLERLLGVVREELA